jgi:hypothetical protein
MRILKHFSRPKARLAMPLVLALFGATALAQGPVNPPPWWGIVDDVTVSLSWNFNTAFAAGQPTVTPDFEAVSPNWYNNPSPWTASSNIEWIATLGGQTGVCGLNGTGTPGLTANLNLFVDNDPHLDWIKIFWFQVDIFEGSTGSVTQSIKEALQDYGRATVTEKSSNLGSGWTQLTVSAQLIPQPDDEEIDFQFIEDAFGTVAIDNLHVSSKCIKPRPDEEGGALGRVRNNINLTATTGRDCKCFAVTKSSTTAAERYWVAAKGPGLLPHEFFEVDAAGNAIGIIVVLPTSGSQSPLGPLDIAVERQALTPTTYQDWIYVLVDTRPGGGAIEVRALNANMSGSLNLAQSTTINSSTLMTGQRMSLAFDPTGQSPTGVPGAGSFWIGGMNATGNWVAIEYNRAGLTTGDSFSIPVDSHGMAYDEALGNFYCFSADPVSTPSGALIQCNGSEISGYDLQPTGVRFCGDLNLTAAGSPPGGIATSMSIFRSNSSAQSDISFSCVVESGAEQQYYEIAGPYRYGYSRYGKASMQNGPPFLGGSFDVTLEGVPNSLFGMLFLGTQSANIPLGPGIQPEAVASLLPSASTSLLPVIAPGNFSQSIPLPNSAILSYSEAFFQWVLLDTTAPGFLGFSQAGKTVLYP